MSQPQNILSEEAKQVLGLLLLRLKTSKRPGRKLGVRNYKDDSLYDIVKRVLPHSTDEWDQVATEYQEKNKDPSPHAGRNVKRHFFVKAVKKQDPEACALKQNIDDKLNNSTGIQNGHSRLNSSLFLITFFENYT